MLRRRDDEWTMDDVDVDVWCVLWAAINSIAHVTPGGSRQQAAKGTQLFAAVSGGWSILHGSRRQQ